MDFKLLGILPAVQTNTHAHELAGTGLLQSDLCLLYDPISPSNPLRVHVAHEDASVRRQVLL